MYYSGVCICLGFFFKISIRNILYILIVREFFYIDFSICIDIFNVFYLFGGFFFSKNRDRLFRR